MQIKLTKKSLAQVPASHTRIAFSSEKFGHHWLREGTDGTRELVIGTGGETVTPHQFRKLIRTVIRTAGSHEVGAIALSATSLPPVASSDASWGIATAAEEAAIAGYTFTTYRKHRAATGLLSETVLTDVAEKESGVAVRRALTVAEYVNHARDIANTPGTDMPPRELAKRAQTLGKAAGVSVSVLNHTAIKKEKLGLLDAVGSGAADPPRFIVMEYYGAGKPKGKTPDEAKRPLLLVGKGITYDTGGLNVKPTGFMHDMHLDMSGGAAVIASICAAAKLKLTRNIVALIPAAENSVSERAIRAGDIVTSHAGKTVEILHTDAEGRLVMADAFSYAARFTPRAILDVATLTGASIAALGQHASALITRDDTFRDELWQLGEETGDRVWPLPLYTDYEQYLKSDRADISNIATNFHRFGGASEAGTFLANFVPPGVRWAHLDMAPRMQSVRSDKLAKGATGEPVRLLVRWLATHG